MQIRKSLDKLIALAGGCLVFATGGGGIAVGAGMAGSGVSLLNAWLDSKAKRGPESQRVLARIRETVRMEVGQGLLEDDAALLDGADHALGEVLLDCIPAPDRLALAFGHPDGFAKAAAAMVMIEVAAKDDLFAETGPRANPLARRFAAIAIEAALESALTDRDYFAGMMPFVLREMSRGIGAIESDLAGQRASLERIDSSNARVEALLKAFEATATGQRASREIGDSRPFVVLARRINQEVDDPDQALVELSAMVELVLQQQADAQRGTNLGALVDGALRRIADKARRGEFDSAASEAAGAFAEWERREAERREAEREAGLGLIAANIEQNMFRRDADAVALWVERRIVLEGGGKAADIDVLMIAADEWKESGEEKGLHLDLAVAVAIIRRLLILCPSRERRIPALVRLGDALQTLGSRESGVARLNEAVAAYRASLELFGREEAPQEWSAIHNNLGNTLQALGSRENGTARLEGALEAYRVALPGLSREREPQNWARAQNNIGGVLMRIGERVEDPAALNEALAALLEALKERSPERTPVEWAATQNNLGSVYYRIWQRDQTKGLLQEAVTAFRAAGGVLSRADMPFRWAEYQNNLGNALRRLDEEEPDGSHLQAAEATYRDALGELTRERAPIQWAGTTASLALTIGLIAARTGDATRLGDAVALARDAHSSILESGHEPYREWADHVLAVLDRIGRDLAAQG
jgi:tetratricopeptide (TPR) repeat protein